MALGAMAPANWFSVVHHPAGGGTRSTRITPGGGATGTVLQANMLADAGFGVADAATALTVQSVLSTAAISSPLSPCSHCRSCSSGTPGARRPAAGVLDRHPRVPACSMVRRSASRCLSAPTAPCCSWAGSSCGCGASCSAARRWTARSGARARSQPRDRIRREIGPRWEVASGASLACWVCSSTRARVLVCTLCGLSANPNPALVLLAFAVASVLGPAAVHGWGGLGFVEAGGWPREVAGRTLAGISTGDALGGDAGLPVPRPSGSPIPLGGIAVYVFRRRHPHEVHVGAAPAIMPS